MDCIVALLHVLSLISGGIAAWAAKERFPKSFRLRTRGRPWFLLVWLISSWPLAVLLRGIRDHGLAEIPLPTVLGGLLWLVILFRWPLVRAVTIPLGLVRTSYYVTLVASFTWWRDPLGGALTAAVLARLRHRRARPWIDGWLRARLEGLRSFRAGGALASALMSDLGGDYDPAREKMRAVGDFDPRVRPREVHRLAAEWLLLDAARRGSWHEVRDAFKGRWREPLRRSRIARLLVAVAQRLLQEPGAPGDRRLLWLHRVSPRRRLSRPLVERALASTLGERPSAAAKSTDSLERALRLYVAWLKAPAARLDGRRLEELADAWQEELDAMRLGDGATQAAFRESVEESLAVLLDAAPVDLGNADPPKLVADALQTVLDFRVSELLDAVEKLHGRVERGGTRSPSHELAEWCGLRQMYEGIAGLPGPALRKAAFSMTKDAVLSQATWMFKVFQERPLANAMFQWLLTEAQATGQPDAETLEMHVSLGV